MKQADRNLRKAAVIVGLIYGVILSAGVLSGCFQPPSTTPTPTPIPVTDDTPAELFGLDQSIPPTMHNAASARELAAVCEEFARQLEADGKREKPRVVDTAGLMECLTNSFQYAFDGRRVATQAYVMASGEAFEKHFEPGGEVVDLSPALRAKAAAFFRALAWSLGEVKDG